MTTHITRSTLRLCAVHDTVDGFCENHNISCCMACHQISYKECRVILITDAADRLIGGLKYLHGKLRRLQLKDQKQKHDLCESKEQSVVSSIRMFYAEIRTIIDDSEKEAIGAVKTEFEKLRSVVLNSARKMAKIKSEADRLNQEITHLQAERSTSMRQEITHLQEERLMSRHDVGAENCHEGSAAVADDSGAFFGNSRCDSSSLEAARLVEKASITYMDTRHILSIYKETLARLEEDSVELSLITSRIDQRSIDTIRAIVKESCEVTKKSADIRTFVQTREISVGGKWSGMRFSNDSRRSPLVVITARPDKLMLISQGGKMMRQAVLTWNPFYLYVQSDKVFVTFLDSNCVTVHRLDNLTETARFTMPSGSRCWGIDGISDNLVVACCDANCVCLLTHKGEIIAKSNHKFNCPCFLVVSTDSDAVYVSEYSSHTIVVISADLSTTLRTISHPDMKDPRGLCVAGNDIYVANCGAGSVLKIDVNGSNCSAVLSLIQPRSICFHARDRVMAIGFYSRENIITYKGEV